MNFCLRERERVRDTWRSRSKMNCGLTFLYLGVLAAAVLGGRMFDNCLSRKYTINVVLLEDNTYEWSLPLVQRAVEEAIVEDAVENDANGLDFRLTANYYSFNTTIYKRQGCGSSTCEGVAILKKLYENGEIGCIMLGPSCTYATYQLVDQEIGLSLSIPIISAGSFGLSCDYKPKLTRILPPARKISTMFRKFLHQKLTFKDPWNTVYVYKLTSNQSEDCFWYINALEAPSEKFASEVDRHMLRGERDMLDALAADKRKSNIFIMCGSRKEVASIKAKSGPIHQDIMFILLDIYNPSYYENTTSGDLMDNVLVITLPQRTYNYYSNSTYNNTINDYVVGYHDGTLLFGKVLREKMLSQRNGRRLDVDPLTSNPFGNVVFNGMGGHYQLDQYGDRDVNYSIIYTATDTKEVRPQQSLCSSGLLSRWLCSTCVCVSVCVSPVHNSGRVRFVNERHHSDRQQPQPAVERQTSAH